MRVSLRFLMLYMAAFAVCLALCFLPRFELGALVLCVAVLATRLFMTKSKWRFVTFGALLGIISATMAALIYSHWHIGSPHNYESMRLVAEALAPLRQLIFPMGSFVGGSIGLLIYKTNSDVKARRLAAEV